MAHLAQALTAFLAAKDLTNAQFAEACGSSQPTISRLTRGDRPAVDTLNAICTKWPDARATRGLLVAHLRDEIERAGRTQDEIEIIAAGVDESDVTLLAREAQTDPELASLLGDMARMIRSHRAREKKAVEAALEALPLAAEPPPAPYGRDSLAKKVTANATLAADKAFGALTPPAAPPPAPAPRKAEPGSDTSPAR